MPGASRNGISPANLLLWTGVVGPTVFVGDWATLGAIRRGYSPVKDAISRLAEIGAPTRPEMTGGFIVYGASLIGYGLALRGRVPGPAWIFATGTGMATLGVAAFPLGTPVSGDLHAVFAAVGYATRAALPVVASRWLVAGGHAGLGRISVVTGALAGALLLASAVGAPAHGLTQRLGLTLADAWVVASALALLRTTGPAGVGSGTGPD
jgi:hypothetical membrane protein